MQACSSGRPLHSRRARTRRIGGGALLLDCAAAGVLLVIFALAHHALPRALRTQDAAAPVMSVVTAARPGVRFVLPDASAAGATVRTENRYESRDVQIALSTVASGSSVCHVLDIHVASVENLKTAFAEGVYGKGVRAHPLAMAKENNAICAINGDYYGSSAESGAVIRNGALYRSNPGNPVLVLYYDGAMRVVEKSAFDGEKQLAAGAYQAWCFGPSLLDADGNALTAFDTDKRIGRGNPRTAIGYYAPGHYCFITVDGRSDASRGMTLIELSSFCESLGLALAYNLDGGRTSVMTFSDRIVNAPSEGGRKSSDIIYIAELGGGQ